MVTVFWASFENEWLRAVQPESVHATVAKLHGKDDRSTASPMKCPAVVDSLHNLFSVASLYDYSFTLDRETGLAKSSQYDQAFFDTHVHVRDAAIGLCSFEQRYAFFTDADSLEMTAQIHPFMEGNDVTRRCRPIPGRMDIGKWFRYIEYAFYFQPGEDEFAISEGDVYQYVQFHTKDKVQFRQFMPNDALASFAISAAASAAGRSLRKRYLADYYKTFSIKKHVLSEIKRNLV